MSWSAKWLVLLSAIKFLTRRPTTSSKIETSSARQLEMKSLQSRKAGASGSRPSKSLMLKFFPNRCSKICNANISKIKTRRLPCLRWKSTTLLNLSAVVTCCKIWSVARTKKLLPWSANRMLLSKRSKALSRVRSYTSKFVPKRLRHNAKNSSTMPVCAIPKLSMVSSGRSRTKRHKLSKLSSKCNSKPRTWSSSSLSTNKHSCKKFRRVTKRRSTSVRESKINSSSKKSWLHNPVTLTNAVARLSKIFMLAYDQTTR